MSLDNQPRPTSQPPFSGTVALLTMARAQEAALVEALKPLGLSTRKFGFLGHIRATPGISFSELARRSRVTVQSVHVAVAALSESGLVMDATAQAGAAASLQLTRSGNAVLGQATERVRELDASLEQRHPRVVATLREEMKRTPIS